MPKSFETYGFGKESSESVGKENLRRQLERPSSVDLVDSVRLAIIFL
ncbi:MAG: hypothetical protein AAB972_04745 [Patescibacteria group bacterium]